MFASRKHILGYAANLRLIKLNFGSHPLTGNTLLAIYR